MSKAPRPSAAGQIDVGYLRLAQDVLSVLGRVRGEMTRDAIRLLAATKEQMPLVITELMGPRKSLASQFLSSSDAEVVAALVELLSCALRALSGRAEEERLVQALGGDEEWGEKLLRRGESGSVVVRRRVLELGMQLYEQERGEGKWKSLLLRALRERSGELRQTTLEFWSRRLGGESAERFLDLLALCHDGESEDAFIGYASYLLLALAADAPDYTMPIHREPLKDGHFQPMPVHVDWRRRNAGLETPTFAESQGQRLLATQSTANLAFNPYPSFRRRQQRLLRLCHPILLPRCTWRHLCSPLRYSQLHPLFRSKHSTETPLSKPGSCSRFGPKVIPFSTVQISEPFEKRIGSGRRWRV